MNKHGLVGTSLEHYRLDAPLGAGAMSEVYLATDSKLGKQVAVKVIHPSVALDSEQVARFEREARAAARLNHPHVAVVHFAGSTSFGAPFYAMELIRGWSMDELIESRMRFRLDQALALFAQACSGLDAAFRAGIFHRDIKPANLMVGSDGILKVVDFGLAKLNDDASITRSGTMMGTPTYMAPEIAKGTGGDHRSDIYSLGVTFFHMLAGFAPFEAETTYGVLLKHIQDQPPRLADVNPKLPERLTTLVDRMLAKEPEARPTSHAQVHHELLEIYAVTGVDPATNPQLSWCTLDERVTVAVGARCTTCGEAYVAYRRPERFHVDVVGWNKNDARAAVALHIGKRVAQDAVARQLEELPYRAAQRLPRDRARQLQRTLFDLGADVELVGADASGRDNDPGRRPVLPRVSVWPPAPQIGAGEGAPRTTLTDTTTQIRIKAALGKVEGPSKVNLALLVLVIVLAGLLVRERLEGDPGESPAEAPAPEAVRVAPTPDPQRPVVSVTAEPTPPDVLEPDRGEEPPPPQPLVEVSEATPEPGEEPLEEPRSDWFDVRDVGPDRERAVAALAALDEAAAQLLPPLRVRPRALRVEITEASLGAANRSWTGAPYEPVLKLPTGGGGTDPDGYRAAARGLVTRAALSQVSRSKAPAWLIVGLSLVAEQGPTSVEENAAVIASDALFPTRMLAGTHRNDLRTERALRSFGSFLLDQHGWPVVRQFAERLGRGDSVDEAAAAAFRGGLSEVELAWQDACGVE